MSFLVRNLIVFTFLILTAKTAFSYDLFSLNSSKPTSEIKSDLKMHILHKSLTYREAREKLFGELHLEQYSNEYEIRDVYCHNIYDESDGVGPGEIPNHRVLNTEHVWPRSRFNSEESYQAQLTDLHHLIPTDSRANSSRGNLYLAEVQGGAVHENCEASKKGRSQSNQRGTYFEPADEVKGNVARALFYFSIRYSIEINDHEEMFLRRWHQEDPVDNEERARNESIYEIQGNRNPFIVRPDLVYEIDNF